MRNSIIYRIRRKLQVVLYKITSVEIVSKLYFRIIMGYKLNLKHPQTFNEKLQWLKNYYFPFNQLAIQCTDKYLVRDFISKMGLEEYLNELIGVWNHENEINWDSLPREFVLKCTHGCGYNIICENKELLDIPKTRKQLEAWLKEDFGAFNAEPHYSSLHGRIICEKFLGGNITDYKFFCFNGKIEFMYIVQRDQEKRNSLYTTCFYENGERAPFRRTEHLEMQNAILPAGFDKMKEMSTLLANHFPFVRVDWFEVENEIFFSELTFTPGGAMLRLDPSEYDKQLGDLFDISHCIENSSFH